MKTFCTCLSGKTKCDCQDLELIVTDRTDFNNRNDMTKEENKHTITLKTEWVDMDKLVLTNHKGDTYTTKSDELMDFILSSESENERLKAEREWISIEDRLPEKTHHDFSDWILATDNGGNIKIEKYDYEYNRFTEKRYDIREVGDSQVTHWMPLPKPPKQ